MTGYPLLHAHRKRNEGSAEQRQRGRFWRPRLQTPLSITRDKGTRGMCTRLSQIPLSMPLVLSLQTAGKHTIIQEALHNLYVGLREERWDITLKAKIALIMWKNKEPDC